METATGKVGGSNPSQSAKFTTNRKVDMQLGTTEEIQAQQLKVSTAETALVVAKLRLRALKGEALLQSGDSVGIFELQEELAFLQNEFGARNLRMM